MTWTTSHIILRQLSDVEAESWARHSQRLDRRVPALKPLTPSEKALLHFFALRESTKHGYAFPGRAHTAEWLGCTVRTIDRKISVLENAKLVAVTRRGGHHSSTNEYRLLVPCEIRHRDREWMSRHPCPVCGQVERTN